jgi:cytoskeleton protein RodZ
MSSLFDDPKPPEGEDAAPPAPVDEAPRPKHTIGALLRETRENYGGDIERIGAALRIRPAYLTALEEGRYDRLPAPVYALGFVRAYAIHMGLDGEEAVRRFKQEASGLEISRDLIFPIPLTDRSIPRRPILIAALLLLFAAYAVWYYLSSGSTTRPERVSEVPADLMGNPANGSNSAAVPPAPPPSPPPSPPAASAAISSTPKPAAQTPPPAPVVPPQQPAAAPQAAPAAPPPPQQAAAPPAAAPASSPPSPPPQQAAAPAEVSPPADSSGDANHVFGATAAPARIVIRAKVDSWLQVRDRDQSVLFQRLLKPDEVYRVPDRPGLHLMTGNAAALDVTVDGNPVPPLSGTVMHNVLLDPDRLMAGTAAVN